MDFTQAATRAERATAAWLRTCPTFDASLYLAEAQDPDARRDPALHYLLKGEAQGLAASASFRAADYLARNPDLAGIGQSLLVHYELHGRSEGRKRRFESEGLALEGSSLQGRRPLVLLFCDCADGGDTFLTGWSLLRELRLTRDVVVVLRREGWMSGSLQTECDAIIHVPPHYTDDPAEIGHLARRLKAAYRPLYALACGTATRVYAVAAKAAGVPVIALADTYADAAPAGALSHLFQASDAVAFVSEGVQRSCLQRREYRFLAQRTTLVARQGPPEHAPAPPGPSPAAVSGRPAGVGPHPFTVVGAGSLRSSHGLDLFIAVAAAMKARAPALPLHFIWMAAPGDSAEAYRLAHHDQLADCSLLGTVSFVEAADPAPVLKAAHVFLASARRDPTALTAVAAALAGLPVVGFEGASGLAEVLVRAVPTQRLTPAHLDTVGAAERLLALAGDASRLQAAGRMTRTVARKHFSRTRYAALLDTLGLDLAKRRSVRSAQAAELEPEHAFDAGLYFGPRHDAATSRQVAITQYLEDTLNIDWSGPAVESHHPRRPLPGFNPFLYAHCAPGFDARSGLDPLADYVARGRPPGPWSHEVITLDASTPRGAPQGDLRVALHGHFHYIESFGAFLDALAANESAVALYLTTTSQASAEILRSQASERYRQGPVEVRSGVNLGRDIGPFLSLLSDELQGYDVVGHVHGKRSSHGQPDDPGFGDRWRHFLWQHLLGPAAPAADTILSRFAGDPELGLVFPENEHLIGWEQNRAIAEELAPRLGLGPLPEHLEFPVGTMFWARPSALRLLDEARFTNADYQAEPLPLDGTLLHAIERLITPTVEAVGFRYATVRFARFAR